MEQAVIIKARRVSSRQVELEEALPDDAVDIQVVATRRVQKPGTLESFLAVVETLPPGTRTKEDIDQQIREERESWESGR